MQRVVILGPGAAGKSTLAARLSELTGLPVIELDRLFWPPGLVATAPGEGAAVERDLVARESWIIDGDLGPYDGTPQVRLEAADTIVFLDFSPVRCAWRAIRRSRERADFGLWLLTYRRRSRPLVRHAIAAHGGGAALPVLPTPRAVRRFIDGLKKGHGVFGCGPPRHRHKTRGQPKASQSPARARPLQGVRPPSAR